MAQLVKFFNFAFILCLVLPFTAWAEDYAEDDGLILSVTLQDDTQPEPGTEPTADFLRCNKDAWRMPGQYIVVMREGTHESQMERTKRRLLARAAKHGHLIEVLQTFSGAFRGFLVKMSSDVLRLAVRLPHVDYIEEDSSIFAQGIPWNLDRIVQTEHAAGKYSPPNNGGQVEVYLLDTSILSSHRELEGRVQVTDFNNVPEEDGVRINRQASTCESHGTHTAGIVNGRDSGVARGAIVNSVRVLNCQGKGTVSGALSALEYIRTTLLAQPYRPLVVLLPFVSGFSRTLNTACRETVRNGGVVVAAAGNDHEDACLYSPASEPQVITVGATNFEDQPVSRTNYGRCVDLFAPGDDIISASSDCPTCFTANSGTSQAAAHVAGIAAVLLNSNPNLTSTEVLQRLLLHSVKHAMDLSAFPEEHRLTTPNMVAALPTSTSEGEELLCRSVWSEKSGTSSSDTTGARCGPGEEMFSCSSFSPNGVRAGETISKREGQQECIAHNGPGGQGAHAIARCCIWARAECQASASEQQGTAVACPSPDHHLTGCSSHSVSGGMADSTRPLHGDRNAACSSGEGAKSHASCCRAPSLQCQLKEHAPPGFNELVEVSCEAGWTLTGCSTLSRGSLTHGAYARGNTCVVTSSGGGEGAEAFAICCRHAQSQKRTESNRK
ncbi:proprotein convertase subtilisin/kexin type 9 [Anguilla anguilla]|uniref:proprotein convertase subtilisin/kexin type 9 n=1 Tax=Anguilla anguilla TaxID=7936 RepID=UPI0015B242C6|nr:proprotein convertase subtilisin/kexin type 9 [Anguilla anguilla]